MASDSSKGKQAKQNLEDLLKQDVKQGPLRRGVGMSLSTETPLATEEEESQRAKSHFRTSAQTQEDTFAQSHESESAISHTRTSARVRRGYNLDEALVTRCKLLAVKRRRKLYEVMDEALRLGLLYLEQEDKNT